MAKIELNAGQEGVLSDVKKTLNHLHRAPAKNTLLSECDVNEPGFANAIGIFGDRGAGKSTLLYWLYEQNKCSEAKCSNASCPNQSHPDDYRNFVFLPPIDCSALAQLKIPSAVALLRIRQYFQEHVKTSLNEKELDKLIKRLDVLIGYAARTDRGFQKLSLELATSSPDYDYYQKKGIEERLKLKAELQQWVNDARGYANDKSFVIFLDDFDLTSVIQVHAWITALLDELRQTGLIFIITANFYRLEHLSWGKKIQFDDKTGRALITKIFPPKNCHHIPDWSIDEAFTFKKPTDMNKTSPPSLEELLNEILKKNTELYQETVFSLLPKLPRGIENFYEHLYIEYQADSKSQDEALVFASWLATCRNEPLMARLLRERHNNSRNWFNHLQLNKQELHVEQWEELIHDAYKRASWNHTQLLPPLPHILPSGKGNLKDKLSEHCLEHSSDEHVPLVHKPEITAPLRDSEFAEQALWAELLLDIDLLRADTRRFYLLSHWQPLVDRIKACQIKVSFPEYYLEAFFVENDDKLTKAVFCWFEYANNSLSIGWKPLFDMIRGKRDPMPLQLLDEMPVNTLALGGDLPTAKDLELLPKRFWLLLVLTDALERCPWQVFSRFLNWLVTTYIALAAAFVCSAYLYCLKECGLIAMDDLNEAQKNFIKILKNRDPGSLLTLNENKIWDELLVFFDTASLEQKLDDNNPLSKVSKQFLQSSVFKDVVALLEETKDFYIRRN